MNDSVFSSRPKAMSMTHRLQILLLAAVASGTLTLGSVSADAAPATVLYGTQVFAGPGPNYPAVGQFAPGTPVEVFGCEEGWGWCDIASGPYRGWAPGNQLQVFYQGMGGPLGSYGPQIGLPIIGFSFDNYWGAHYRNQPWFADRARWNDGGGFRGGPEGHFNGQQMHDFRNGPGNMGGMRGGPPMQGGGMQPGPNGGMDHMQPHQGGPMGGMGGNNAGRGGPPHGGDDHHGGGGGHDDHGGGPH